MVDIEIAHLLTQATSVFHKLWLQDSQGELPSFTLQKMFQPYHYPSGIVSFIAWPGPEKMPDMCRYQGYGI